MARTKAVLDEGVRLSDYLSASLLARVFTAETVHAALDEHGRNSQRIRRFPAVVGAILLHGFEPVPRGRTGHPGYPRALCAVLVECASHAILDANMGAYRDSEGEVCKPMLRSLEPGMLCLADRGFKAYEYWKKCHTS